MTTNFSELNLHPEIVQTLTDLGYETPTPIQSSIIPVMLTGQDVIGQAQTGTGKTAAFSLPILHNLTSSQKSVQALVLAPTRELAMQVAKAMHQYGRYPGAKVLAVYGGQSYSRQISQLKRGVDVVVGTPGRLLDLIQKQVLDLSQVKTVVLDEADEMLSMGFIEDIESILDATPSSRQTALFSATLPGKIRQLAEKYMHNPQAFTIKHKQLTVDRIEERCYVVNEEDKLAALTRLFESEEISSALIFARTRQGTHDLAAELTARNYPAEALNGDMDQNARERVLNRFRQNQLKVLVGTDVAARGLDIDDISHIFNYDLPQDPEIYVHRVGRTGRAGKTGIAITLLTPREGRRLQRIEAYTKQRITKTSLPTIKDIQTYRENQLIENMEVWLKRGRCRREQTLVTQLVEQGYDLLEIAAVGVKLARAEEKQRPIAPVSEVREWSSRAKGRKRRERNRNDDNKQPYKANNQFSDEDMVSLTLNKGKSSGIRVNHVVGTLAHFANIPGYSLGKIRVKEEHTMVDVPQQFVRQVLAQTGTYKIGKQQVTITLAHG